VIQLGESVPQLVLAVAILLFAQPQKLSAPKVVRALTNIEFCLDISGSMTAPFGEARATTRDEGAQPVPRLPARRRVRVDLLRQLGPALGVR
jgi:hypothetical protein